MGFMRLYRDNGKWKLLHYTRPYTGVILGLYRVNGKENGNYYFLQRFVFYTGAYIGVISG